MCLDLFSEHWQLTLFQIFLENRTENSVSGINFAFYAWLLLMKCTRSMGTDALNTKFES